MLPEPKKSLAYRASYAFIWLVILLVMFIFVWPIIPALICSLPVTIPLLVAGWIFHKENEKKRKRPRMPPEQMV